MSLVGRVCLVTGASRGVGKGVAKALSSQGAKVYITGRESTSLKSVSEQIGAHPVVCDHSDDNSIRSLFQQIEAENNGQLDFLVNNCFSAGLLLLGKENDQPVNKFWELDPLVWDQVNRVGLRANYVASVQAAKLMVPRKSGTIVNISSAGGLTYAMNAAYGIGKAGQDRMAQDMNMELKGTGVTALAVWPGGVKTELSTEHILNTESDNRDMQLLKSMVEVGQTPDWVGRTVAALVTDKNISKKGGRVNWCYDIADEFDVRENDGSKVASHRSLKGIYLNLLFVLKLTDKYGFAKFVPSFIKIPKALYSPTLWVVGNKF